MPKLTKTVIDNNLAKEKHYFVWDTEIKGFGCQILKGGKKTYAFYYRSPLTRKKACIKIGCHGNITVDFARNKAKALSATVASGIDPREQKKEKLIEERQSILFGDFFNVFKEKHIATYKGKGAYNNMSISRLYILPWFAKKKLEEITTRDIRQFLDSMSRISTTANRCFELLSVSFGKAEEWEYLPHGSNPCKGGVRKYKENRKQRFLTDLELAKLEQSLTQQEKEQKASYCTVNAIRMLLYTGCREGEVLNLKWENVHIKDNYVYLDDTKTGEDARPLNPKAVNVLTSMKPKEGNPYIFYGRVPGKPLAEIKTAWKTILKRAGIKGFRLHDLRHSYASFALKKGIDLYTVSKLLGHKNIATTTRYAHLELEHLKKAANKVAEVFA